MKNKTNYIRIIFNDCTEDNFFVSGKIDCLDKLVITEGSEYNFLEPAIIKQTEKMVIFEGCMDSKIINGKHAPVPFDDKNHEYTRIFMLENIKSISKYTVWD